MFIINHTSLAILATALTFVAPTQAGYWSAFHRSRPPPPSLERGLNSNDLNSPLADFGYGTKTDYLDAFPDPRAHWELNSEPPEEDGMSSIKVIYEESPTDILDDNEAIATDPTYDNHLEDIATSFSSPAAANTGKHEEATDVSSWEEFNRNIGKYIGIIFGVVGGVFIAIYITVCIVLKREKRKRNKKVLDATVAQNPDGHREHKATGWFNCFGKSSNNSGGTSERIIKRLRRYERFYKTPKKRPSIALTELDPSTGAPIKKSKSSLRTPPLAYHPATPFRHVGQDMPYREDEENSNPFDDPTPDNNNTDLESGGNNGSEWNEEDINLDVAVEPVGYSPLGHFSENGGYGYGGATTNLQRFS